MYGQYLIAIVRRALQPTVRITDGLQILAASAAPAIADITGVPVPESNSVLAYIGATAVAFITLRLFFVAPYQVWRQQVGEIGSLRLALSRPERIEVERMAKLRARHRVKLSSIVRRIYLSAYNRKTSDEEFLHLIQKGLFIAGKCGSQEILNSAYSRLVDYGLRSKERGIGKDSDNVFADLTNNLCLYLHGRITGEALALRLPPELEVEKPL
jgi:hypothetical protein